MYQPTQQPDFNRFTKQPVPPLRLKSTNNPMFIAFQNTIGMQQDKFEEMQRGCETLQRSMSSIQEMVQRIEQRVQELNQGRSAETIFNLKTKQNEFIIQQLKQKIRKFQKNQQNAEIQIRHLKKQLQNMKRSDKQKGKERTNVEKMREDIIGLEQGIRERDDRIEELSRSMKRLSEEKKMERKQSVTNEEKQKRERDRDREEDYKMLQGKLLQLQKQFQLKVTSLHDQVRDKNNRIKELQQQLDNRQKELQFKTKEYQLKLNSYQQHNPNIKDQSPNTMTLTFNPSRNSLNSTQSPSIYELQLKLTHQQNLYKELQQEYTNHLTTSNNLEIQLHQQIHQQKIQLHQEKKRNKTDKKKLIQYLHSLASFINKRTFNYLDSNTDLQNLIEELKKIFTKEKEKWDNQIAENKKNQQDHIEKITILERENRKLKNQNNQIKQEIDSLKEQLQKIQIQKEKEREKQKQKEKKIKRQNSSQLTESNAAKRSSLNGSLAEISSTKTENPSLMQEKYRCMIEALRSQIQQKQQQIAQLESLQTVDFQKSKEKILQMESQLADCRNEIKKQERQARELKQKISEYSRQSQALKNTLKEGKQKYIKQKQQLQTIQQNKIKTLEQKITKLKQQNQLIDSKCQQKVMKYNKLKTKVQKLEMYNNETEKRKDGQIEELIKKSQQLKMDCKLLQEKLNISQALQQNTQGGEGSQSNVKTALGYNRDLIEQIQMERDRILEQYESKRRQYLKLKQQYDNVEQQKQKLQQKLQKLQQQRQSISQQKHSIYQQKQKAEQQKQRLTSQTTRISLKSQQQKQSLNNQLFELRKQLASLKADNQSLNKEVTRLQEQITGKSKQEYQHLKKELQTQMQIRNKKQKEEQALVERIKQLKQENQKLKKEQQDKTKTIENKCIEKLKEKQTQYHQELNKLKEQHASKLKDMQHKLTEAGIREENLVNIINYKNLSVSGTLRESMKGQEDEEFMEARRQFMEESKAREAEERGKEGQKSSQEELRVNWKMQMIDQETNTASGGEYFLITQHEDVIVQPTIVSGKELKLERVQSVKVRSQKQFVSKQVQENIFEEQKQLLQFLKINYPHVLRYLVDANTLPQNMDQPVKATFGGNIERVEIGVNTQSHGRQSLKNNNVINDEKNTHILENQQKQSINNRESITDNDNEKYNRQSLNILKSTIKESSYFFQDQLLAGSGDLSRSSVQQTPITDSAFLNIHSLPREKFNPQLNKIQQINLFQNLKPSNLDLQLQRQNMDDNFQICQEGQSINVGQTALNLHIKEIFNKLREELQKVFNGEDISLSMIKILPRQLEDDYNQFISYVKQKILQIRSENQLSFIMAEVGDSPSSMEEELEEQLRTFMNKKVAEDVFAYKKLAEQKQALITSLMNQRTMQQNTINQLTTQQQQVQQQHENRFMNQCTIYKREIKQLKKKVDNLQMSFQSLKNVFKNTMEIWVDQIENEDDLRDNFTIYKNIAKLNELQSTRLNYYIFRYREIKNIPD